jgi:glycosyltransferase involved in cell wall biosynthesis
LTSGGTVCSTTGKRPVLALAGWVSRLSVVGREKKLCFYRRRINIPSVLKSDMTAGLSMKQIVMLQGMGNNERGWARLVSKFGRVTLIQQGLIQHVETWESDRCIFNGPESSVISTRKIDEYTFSALTFLRSLARFREQLGNEKVDVVIASNYSLGLVALWLRWRRKTGRVCVLFTDYLPQRGSFAVRLHRRITSALNRYVARHADEVWSVSPRIPTMQENPKNFVVPICLDDNQVSAGQRTEIGYIGFPSPDHALDILFAICKKHNIRLNIVGHSSYLDTIKHLAPADTVFHGTLNDNVKIKDILSRCFCGYAVYRNTGPQSYSFYGIPSKTFYYFASNTPVVTTNTADFTPRIEEFGVGRVVEPAPEEIEKAILQLKNNYETYSHAIDRFRSEWNHGAETFHRERMSVLLNDNSGKP